MQGDTYAFIVRIWTEPREDEDSRPAWRGFVEQVGGDNRTYFLAWEDLVRFIQEGAGIPGGPSASEIAAG